MVFKTERLLLKISAILGIINLVLMLFSGILLNALEDNPEFAEMMGNYGYTTVEDIFEISFIINLILRLIVIIALFYIAKKVNRDNYKTMGILTIVLGVVTFRWLLGFIASILVIIAGIMILINSKKALEESH